MLIGSKYPKNILFNFEKNFTGDSARELPHISVGYLLYEMVYYLGDLKRMCCETVVQHSPCLPRKNICKRRTLVFSQTLCNARFIVFTMLARMYIRNGVTGSHPFNIMQGQQQCFFFGRNIG